MLIELGKTFRLATGAHARTVAVPSAFPATATPSNPAEVSKGMGPGGTVNEGMTAMLNTPGPWAGGPALTGSRPSPGPLPPDDEPFIDPLRTQFQYGSNQVWTPRAPLRPFEILRRFADVSDIVRICIETRKDQLCSLDWSVKPRQKGSGSKEKESRCVQFLESPDRVNPFNTWMSSLIEEMLVCDNLTIFRRKNKGGEFYAAEIIDGDTIKVLIDQSGRLPLAPHKAYRQIVWGVPVGDYTTEELYYVPRNVRTKTPYGFSPVEAIILDLSAMIYKQVFNVNYYSEGNVPVGLLENPTMTTVAQLREYQTYLDNMLAGNAGTRSRIRAVAAGTKLHEFQKADWDPKWDEHLLKLSCAAFAVPPSEIGFTNDVNRATGKQQENIVYRRGVKPGARWIKALLDRILANDLKCPEYEAVYSGGEPEDRLTQARTDQIYVNMGARSVDEIRARNGDKQIGLGCYVMTSAGPVPVEQITGQPEVRGDDEDVASASDVNDDEDVAPLEIGSAVKAAKSDLARWRAKAIKAAKRGKSPDVPFTSLTIPPAVAAAVAGKLAGVSDVAGVVKVFASADARVAKAVQATAKEKALEARLQKKLASAFTLEGTALAQHVEASL